MGREMFVFLRQDLARPRLPSNSSSSCLWLFEYWDYRHAPPCPVGRETCSKSDEDWLPLGLMSVKGEWPECLPWTPALSVSFSVALPPNHPSLLLA
jgi:hypothetical protein